MRGSEKTFTRLREDPGVASAMRQDLENARDAVPFDVERGRVKFVAALATVAGLAAGGVATGTAVSAAAGGAAGGAGAAKGAGALAGWLAKGALAKTLMVGAVGAAGLTAVTVATVATRDGASDAGQDRVARGAMVARPTAEAPAAERPDVPAVEQPVANAVGAANTGEDEMLPQPAVAMGAESPAAATQVTEATSRGRRQRSAPNSARATNTRAADKRSLAVAPSSAAVPNAAPSQEPLAQEIAHLSQLRALAQRDPPAAVAFADQGHGRFSRGGVFFQEREAIAIVALDAAGQQSQARTRARRFLSQFPTGPFSERIRALLPTAP